MPHARAALEEIERELADLEARRTVLVADALHLLSSAGVELERRSFKRADFLAEVVSQGSTLAAPAPARQDYYTHGCCGACGQPYPRSSGNQRICQGCRAAHPTWAVSEIIAAAGRVLGRLVCGVTNCGAEFQPRNPRDLVCDACRFRHGNRSPTRINRSLAAAAERRAAMKGRYERTDHATTDPRDSGGARGRGIPPRGLGGGGQPRGDGDHAGGDRARGGSRSDAGSTPGAPHGAPATVPGSGDRGASPRGVDRTAQTAGERYGSHRKRGIGEAPVAAEVARHRQAEGDLEGIEAKEPEIGEALDLFLSNTGGVPLSAEQYGQSLMVDLGDPFEDIETDAPPRRQPGRPAKASKLRDPRYRQVLEPEGVAATGATSWWTKPRETFEDFSRDAAERHQEIRHTKAAAAVKTPINIIGWAGASVMGAK